MNRGIAALVAASGITGGTIWFVLERQRSERARMHQGVLRDIEAEAFEKATAESSVDRECDNGVCELKATRFRNPASGKVYEPVQHAPHAGNQNQ